MQVSAITAAKERVELLSFAQELTELKRVTPKEWHGPCPICGGTDRFRVHTQKQTWACRKDSHTPSHGDVIDLAALAWNISTIEAAKKLSGEDYTPTTRRTPIQKERGAADHEAKEWQSRARGTIEEAVKALPNSAGLTYLESRGITLETCKRYHVGYRERVPVPVEGNVEYHPGIVLPLIGKGGEVCAVKHRLLDPPAPKFRFVQMKGSRAVVFGGHALSHTRDIVVTEGEINALSIAQALKGARDVLSPGSEALTVSTAVALLAHYERVVVWMDSREKIEAAIEKHSTARLRWIASPRDHDANDILKRYGERVLREMVLSR